MFVITADQRGSTRTGTRVEQLLEWFHGWQAGWADAVALPLERTVGDEVQGVLTSADATVDLALDLMRQDIWSVGIGAGAVDEPLASHSRESSGPAFVLARRAVERSRGRGEPTPIVVAAEDARAEEDATAILQLLGAVVRKRSQAGWQVSDLERDGLTQSQIAHRLGVSAQAVSQRKAAGLLDEEMRARPVAAALLSTAERVSLDNYAERRDDE